MPRNIQYMIKVTQIEKRMDRWTDKENSVYHCEWEYDNVYINNKTIINYITPPTSSLKQSMIPQTLQTYKKTPIWKHLHVSHFCNKTNVLTNYVTFKNCCKYHIHIILYPLSWEGVLKLDLVLILQTRWQKNDYSSSERFQLTFIFHGSLVKTMWLDLQWDIFPN